MSNLKPCPFCGAKAALKNDNCWYWVSCTSCDATGSSNPSESSTVQTWNSRVHESKLKADAIREAAYHNRRSLFDEGDKWLCSVESLINYADDLERGDL